MHGDESETGRKAFAFRPVWRLRPNTDVIFRGCALPPGDGFGGASFRPGARTPCPGGQCFFGTGASRPAAPPGRPDRLPAAGKRRGKSGHVHRNDKRMKVNAHSRFNRLGGLCGIDKGGFGGYNRTRILERTVRSGDDANREILHLSLLGTDGNDETPCGAKAFHRRIIG